MMTKEEATKQAHHMEAYFASEQSDSDSQDFDDLWQSLYDVCQLATYGIVDLTPEEIKDALVWLKDTQALTKQYQTLDIYFDKEDRQ